MIWTWRQLLPVPCCLCALQHSRRTVAQSQPVYTATATAMNQRRPTVPQHSKPNYHYHLIHTPRLTFDLTSIRWVSALAAVAAVVFILFFDIFSAYYFFFSTSTSTSTLLPVATCTHNFSQQQQQQQQHNNAMMQCVHSSAVAAPNHQQQQHSKQCAAKEIKIV